MKLQRRTENPSMKLIVFCVAIYVASYLGRKSFDSSINEIMAFYGQEKSTVGLVGSFFFIAYAAGQVIHGLMCKYYNPKFIIGLALFVTSLMNLLIGITPVWAFKYIKYIWLINGLAHAVFWSLIILVMSTVVAKKYKPRVMVALLIPVPFGTFLTYVISALMSYLNNFRYTFYLSAGLLFILGVIWAISSKSLFEKCRLQRIQLNEEDLVENKIEETSQPKPKNAIPKSFIMMFAVLAVVAVINNLVKDGINTWTPTLLKEKYHLENWFSVLLTLFIPMFAMGGSFIALFVYKKLKNYSLVCGVLYSLASIIFVILLLCINLNTWLITLVSFILVVLLMSGINNVVTFIFPMENGDKVNAGMLAGFIDGFCYSGSAIASFALGKIAESFGGWDVVMYFLLALCVFASVICFLSMFIRKSAKN